MTKVFRLVLLLVLAFVVVGLGGQTTVNNSNAGFGLCIDGQASFDPLAITGGCFLYDEHAGAAPVIGRALISGDYASAGTEVEAFVNGNSCGSTNLPSGGQYHYFELYVLASAEREGCAVPGDPIEFKINGESAAETARFPANLSWPIFQSLTVLPDHAWYWFERISSPGPLAGTLVEALVGATVCATTTIGGQNDISGFYVPPNIRGFSRLVVPSAEAQPGCAQNGSLVEFRVDGLRAETAVLWRPGVQQLNLLVQGDANCDFLVDPRDATLALQNYAGLVDSVPCHGDADRDGDIDVFDARHILEFAAGIFPALPL